MSKAKEWTPYKAALRRKKIAHAKWLKHRQYEEEMNRKANERPTSSHS